MIDQVDQVEDHVDHVRRLEGVAGHDEQVRFEEALNISILFH